VLLLTPPLAKVLRVDSASEASEPTPEPTSPRVGTASPEPEWDGPPLPPLPRFVRLLNSLPPAPVDLPEAEPIAVPKRRHRQAI
jgi:hypothetical protein